MSKGAILAAGVARAQFAAAVRNSRGALESCSRSVPDGRHVAHSRRCSPGVVGTMHTP